VGICLPHRPPSNTDYPREESPHPGPPGVKVLLHMAYPDIPATKHGAELEAHASSLPYSEGSTENRPEHDKTIDRSILDNPRGAHRPCLIMGAQWNSPPNLYMSTRSFCRSWSLAKYKFANLILRRKPRCSCTFVLLIITPTRASIHECPCLSTRRH